MQEGTFDILRVLGPSYFTGDLYKEGSLVNPPVALSSLAQRDTFVFDNFDRIDQTLNGNKTITGKTWVLSGAGASTASISNGKYINTDNTYASLDFGKKITRIAGAFSFLPSSGSDDPTVETMALIADVAQIGLSTMLHFQFSPQRWELVQYIAGVSTTILSGAHNCVRDGSVYSVAMEISGNVVTVIPPQGPIQSYTNASIGSTTYRYGIWQITQNGKSSGSSFSRWHVASMGYDAAQVNRALGAGLPASQIDFQGTQTNDSARPGFIGEEIISSVSGATAAAATNVFDDLTSISLGVGDWDVSACYNWEGNGSTSTSFVIGISSTSGNSATGLVLGQNRFDVTFASSSTTPISMIAMVLPTRIPLGSTTTYYLKRRFTYTVGTPQSQGGVLRARRMR